MGAVPSPCKTFNQTDFAKDRDRIIREQLPQVWRIARRIRTRLPRHIELDDLIQTGVLGLMKALAKYDPTRRVQLASYTRHRIQGAILDSLRDQDWSSRLLRQKARRVEAARQRLRNRLGREPSPTETASELGMGLERWHRLRGELQALEWVSLDALPRPGIELGAQSGLRTLHEDPYELCKLSEMRNLLVRALAALSPRKRQVLELYYFKGLAMKQVGAKLGVCESRISQMHSAALVSLRAKVSVLLRARRSAAVSGMSALTPVSSPSLEQQPTGYVP